MLCCNVSNEVQASIHKINHRSYPSVSTTSRRLTKTWRAARRRAEIVRQEVTVAGRPSGTLAMTITCGGVEGGGFGLRKDLIAGGRCVCTDLRTHHEAGDEHLQRVPAAPDGDGVEDDARGDGEEGDEAHEVEHLHLADACVGMARGRECSLG